MTDMQAAIDRSADDVAPMRAMQLTALKLVLGTVGRLSAGVRAGWRTGFGSGVSLDHAYRNVPEGITPIGRWLDRVYLDAAGWRAVRRRRLALAALLESTVDDLRRQGRGAHVLDIAAGVGRYVLELMQARPELGISAELRDRDARSLAAGRALARRLGVTGVRFVEADAFDPGRRPRTTPTVAIVSGFYELFPDDALIACSLGAVHAALAPGGALLYTNQPWHPQLDLIARVLVTGEGRPWVMRCRPQSELDALVTAAGFRTATTVADDEGIFTVSRADKVRS
jgi:SAM-dependent methyltransferase